MAKTFKYNPDQAIDQRNKSKAIKQDKKTQGRINKQFLRSVTE
jgi:hypothetical protein